MMAKAGECVMMKDRILLQTKQGFGILGRRETDEVE